MGCPSPMFGIQAHDSVPITHVVKLASNVLGPPRITFKKIFHIYALDMERTQFLVLLLMKLYE